MSDLSLLSSLTPAPARPAPAGAAFAWPMPALASYPLPAPQAQPEPCEIEGRSGQLITGQLLGLHADQGVLHLRLPDEAAALPLQLAQLRRVTLTRAIAPLAPAHPGGAAVPPPLAAHGPQPFVVHWQGGGSATGQTIGHVEHALGLFVFPPLADAASGAVQRVLFPRPACERFDIGAPLGEVLVQQAAATPAQIDAAVAEQQRQRSRKLGELLVAHGVVGIEALFAALDRQARLPMMKLGDALVALGHLSEAELVEALRRQDHDRRQPLGALLEQRGLVTRAALLEALAQKMGYPLVDLARFPRDAALQHRLPAGLARRLLALPLVQCGGRIVVALPDPTQAAAVDELAAALGMPVAPVLATEDGLRQILMPEGEAGHAPAPATRDEDHERLGDAGATPAASPDAASAPADAPQRSAAALPDEPDTPASFLPPRPLSRGDAAALAALGRLVLQAAERGATAVHLEGHAGDAALQAPMPEAALQARVRRDGRLEAPQPLPLPWQRTLLARIKALAGLAAGQVASQSGVLEAARLLPAGTPSPWPPGATLQVTTVPLHDGHEDLVLRLPSRLRLRRLDQLSLSARDHARLTPLLERPGGLLLVAGPARSGRTSTLHALLHHLAAPQRSLVTLEPRLQIHQPAARAMALGPQGDTAAALHALREADADVVLVDALPDAAALQAALALAAAGTLVLAGLAGRCAAEALARAAEQADDPWLLADTLLGVQAQRLVRRWCSHCRMSRPAKDAEVAEWLDAHLEHGPRDAPAPSAGDTDAAAAARAALLQDWIERRGRDGQLRRYHGAGCPQCQGTGRRGRTAVHELLVVSRELRRLIRARAPAWHLQRQAMREGMRTLRQDAIDKMLAGAVPPAALRPLADLTP